MSTQTSSSSTAAKAAIVDDELAKAEAEANAAVKGEGAPASESAPGDKTPALEGKPEGEKDEEAEVDLSQLSDKAQKRFQKLSEKAKRAEELEKEVARLKTAAPQVPTIPEILSGEKGENGLPWDKPSEDGTRVLTEDEYEKDVEKKARMAVQEELAKERTLNQLSTDVTIIEDKYPEFKPPTDEDPNPSFDQELVETVSSWYKAMFAQNQKLRLISFVDQIMRLRAKGTEQGKAQVTADLAKQAAEQAVGPSGAPSSKGQDLESLIRAAKTPEELAELEKRLPHSQ